MGSSAMHALRRLFFAAGVVWSLANLEAAPVAAQQGPDHRLPEGSISGAVVDAETSLPLAAATVVLEPESAGVLPAGTSGGSAFMNASRALLSDSAGAYRFEGLPAGGYRVRVTRSGYRSAAVAVELRGAADSRVSIGLNIEPISLQPLEVTAEAADPYGRTRSAEPEMDGARVAAARLRQQRFLETDARGLTHGDVVEAVTLGETDLFRALHRLPGVSTRDDYTAELWTRGAPWDQTRVYFDELPLFNPVHGFGLVSGVSPNAIGAAWLHPGVRSAAIGEGAAGVLDLKTRRGTGSGELNGVGELSLLSSSLSLDQRILEGRAAWMLSGRRTYLDWLTLGIGQFIDGEDVYVPYSFSDLAGRFDLKIDEDRTLEVSGLRERDRITGDVPDALHGNRAHWGNTAGRITFASRLGSLHARHTLGISHYGARVREHPVDSARTVGYSAPSEPRTDNTLTHARVSGALAPESSGAERGAWELGYEVVRQSARYDGPPAAPYGWRGTVDDEPLSRESDLAHAAIWGEREWAPGERLTMRAGLRLEAGAPLRNGGGLRVAPRVRGRYALSPDLAISAGAGRTYQYTQALAPAGVSPHTAFHASQLWLLAGEEVPAIRSDIATLGAEAWLGGAWLASVHAYLRRATGVAMTDPSPGVLAGRPLFVSGENMAHGLELSARKLAGRWTGSAAYTYGESEMEAVGLRFPAAADRRHSLDATSMLRLGRSLRLGAAYTIASGAPFTRVYAPHWSCSGVEDCDDRPRAESPNGQRTPAYASLDLLFDWTHAFGSWEMAAYLQVRNALFRDNSTTYDYTSETCPGRGSTWRCPVDYELVDRFEMGLPILPVFGFRVQF